ncbi:MAG: NAD(P)/FAD-dependent oxidoreductase [Sandaracinaceae bacterium]|nr:MAG: NAD(P)/FAD-dependent oxidoreductase [Sandaracinaceae bacterium]
MKKPHVVILGGGFGGLATAKSLRRAPVRVTLVDQSNHHLFQPLLYQVATSALTAPDIAAPLRKLLRKQENTQVLMARAVSIDPDARVVRLDQGELEYDYLVLATGMVNNYFGHPEWEAHAPGLKTLREALDVRSRVLRAYEAAERETDPERRKELLTFVLIGAGPTGVEMAGALREIAAETLAADFRTFDADKDVRVVLLEGTDRVLPAMHPESSRDALTSLKELGVEVHLETFAESVDAHGVYTADGMRIQAATVVWAAGLKASPLTEGLGAERDRAGRVKVEPDLTVPGRPEVYVLGDLISLEQDGEPLPGVAQTAIQSGKFAAEQIDAEVQDLPKRARFVYKDKGSMATIGRARAVAEVSSSRFSGFFAWMLWLVIHILFLVDFRNRIAVLMEWAYAYVTWRRSARVILDAPSRHRPALERDAILRSELTRSSERPAATD